jgi:hypothetical protein
MPSLIPDDWARIRYEYEHTAQPVEAICAAHSISSGTLRDRMRRWGWTRRRTPIPRDGPPALAVPLIDLQPAEPPGAAHAASPPHPRFAPHPDPLPALLVEDGCEHPVGSSNTGVNALCSSNTDVNALARESEQADAAAIVPGLQSAVARLLPAIAAITAKLAAGPHAPRDIEQMGRALGTLTRTLRELNALLSEQRDAAPADAGDPLPDDIDEFRRELARRIEAFFASQDASAAIPAAQGDADDAPC